ncbi:hypothetical protein ACFJIX_21160 [Roseateles sp. UC29_93]|uniref:hypothetical protein n=1 Tax=Roseateles sp. UC29_93 TaxID=3350177 RepID=UPI00366C918D
MKTGHEQHVAVSGLERAKPTRQVTRHRSHVQAIRGGIGQRVAVGCHAGHADHPTAQVVDMADIELAVPPADGPDRAAEEGHREAQPLAALFGRADAETDGLAPFDQPEQAGEGHGAPLPAQLGGLFDDRQDRGQEGGIDGLGQGQRDDRGHAPGLRDGRRRGDERGAKEAPALQGLACRQGQVGEVLHALIPLSLERV